MGGWTQVEELEGAKAAMFLLQEQQQQQPDEASPASYAIDNGGTPTDPSSPVTTAPPRPQPLLPPAPVQLEAGGAGLPRVPSLASTLMASIREIRPALPCKSVRPCVACLYATDSFFNHGGQSLNQSIHTHTQPSRPACSRSSGSARRRPPRPSPPPESSRPPPSTTQPPTHTHTHGCAPGRRTRAAPRPPLLDRHAPAARRWT